MELDGGGNLQQMCKTQGFMQFWELREFDALMKEHGGYAPYPRELL